MNAPTKSDVDQAHDEASKAIQAVIEEHGVAVLDTIDQLELPERDRFDDLRLAWEDANGRTYRRVGR